jgi:hypothetical protein
MLRLANKVKEGIRTVGKGLEMLFEKVLVLVRRQSTRRKGEERGM